MRRFLSPKSLFLMALLPLGGCQLLGIVGIVAKAMPKIVPAAYTGLAGKDVAVMVWTDRAISVDWPNMSIDVGASIRKKLLAGQADDKPKELEGTTFPVTPQSIARFQLDHPEMDNAPITEIAPQVGVHRLIYIEITRFQTRSDMAVNTDLYLGQIVANIKVVEYENGQAKIGYKENNVTIQFPKKAPADGVSNLGDDKTYVLTVDAFTTQAAWRFYKHEEEREVGE